MEKIEVTEEMRTRILQNISQNCRTEKKPPLHTAHSKSLLYRMLPLAACLLLTLGLARFLSPSIHTPQNPQAANPMTPVQSLQDLSDFIGFEVRSIADLPFVPHSVLYTAYSSEIAETKYVGDSSTYILRQAKGSTDISGNYTNYPFQEQRELAGKDVLLKGENPDCISLAIWFCDGFSFSLTFIDGASLEICEQTLSSIEG